MTKNHPAGILTHISLIIILIAITIIGGLDWLALLGNLGQFFTGHITLVADGSLESFNNIILNGIGLILIIYMVATASGILISSRLEAKSYDHQALDAILSDGSHRLFKGVLLEELLARYLFLGLIAPIFHSSAITIFLILIGNSLFAAVHLFNYKDKKERNLSLVASQFLSGLLLSYIFLRYGLVITFIIHFFFDVLLMSTLKKQPLDRRHFNLLAYNLAGLLLTIAILVITGTKIASLPAVFTAILETGTTTLTFPTILLLILGSNFLLGAASKLLLFDYGLGKPASISKSFAFYTLIIFSFGIFGALQLLGSLSLILSILLTVPALLFVGISATYLMKIDSDILGNGYMAILLTIVLSGISYLASLYVPSLPLQAALVGIIYTSLSYSISGSELASDWLIGLPTFFLALVAYNTFGFWSMALLLMCYLTINIIPKHIKDAAPKPLLTTS